MKCCIEEVIDAAHYIPKHKSCGQVHGHSYRIRFCLQGDFDYNQFEPTSSNSETEFQNGNMLVDFHKMKDVFRRVLADLDHQLLNDVMVQTPTAENMCRLLQTALSMHWPDMGGSIRVYEGYGKYCEDEW